ncbi:hypothetical protein BDY17DRAFT_314243 [Neohortaea acidophila]|uniref:Uncharacterized protein n=1 Tax=Neohortaea acidophila TaxID=245834 RepID=A0A6A6PGK3_9PEZI|nr:uncharacterized protein BDY17DRAFT_314243 [Neohortaea acidophila]KAF2478427.1 hypothetical protein BDY17DRAFT_314243 [Neohortaea acidophila]
MSLLRMPSPPKMMTETEFLTCLHLNLGVEHDRRQYHAMKANIMQSCQSICHDRSCLLPYLQNDLSIQAPFIWTQITEVSLQEEARRIYCMSSPDVQRLYDLGTDTRSGTRRDGSSDSGGDDGGDDGSVTGVSGVDAKQDRIEESWVMRWLLWRTLLSSADENEASTMFAMDITYGNDGGDVRLADPRARQTYWDPARQL